MEECDIHPGNTKHFYCSQHYDLFCVACSTEHLDCRDVTFLTEISETSKSLLAHLKRQREGVQSLTEDSVTCIDGTEQIKEETLQYVEQVRSDFNRFIDNLKQDVNTRYTQFQSDIKRQIDLYEEHIQTIEKSLSDLNIQILFRQESEDLHQPSKIALEILSRTQDEFSLVDGQILPAKFDLLKHFERQLQDDFEKMEVYSQTDLYQTSDIGVDTFTLQYSEKVILSDVQVPVVVEGEDWCAVLGCAVVQDGRVVIADWLNMCVKLVKVPDMIQSGDNVGTEAEHQQEGRCRGSVLCKLKLSDTPGHVTAISQDQVAVTLPNKSQVHILKVDQQTLTCVREISTENYTYWDSIFGINSDAKYWGITYGPGILVMVKVDRRQTCLTVATLEEETVSVVKVLQYTRVDDGRTLLPCECYVTAAEHGKVYVTNCDDDTVTRLTLTGEVLGQYKFEGLRGPYGICVHPTDGSVFICYWWSDCILRMTPDGREIQRFKVSNPHSVYVTGDNRMIVGQWRDTLKMFQLS